MGPVFCQRSFLALPGFVDTSYAKGFHLFPIVLSKLGDLDVVPMVVGLRFIEEVTGFFLLRVFEVGIFEEF